MPQCKTRYFGTISYDTRDAIEFPAGLPGFEQRRLFLPVDDAERRPMVFLQSLEEQSLCFLTLPVLLLDPGYLLQMSPEDVAVLGLKKQPAIPAEAVCLALISVLADGSAAANLLAPVVIHAAGGRGVQSVRDDAVYSCRQPLGATAGAPPCL